MTDNHDLTLTRMINAPLDRVWRAWTDPAEIQQWWGPNGVTNPQCIWEAKPGGKIAITMLAGPELGPLAGQHWPMTGEFESVTPQRELVYMASPIIDDQAIMDTRTTVSFEADSDKTRLTVDIKVTRKTPAADGPLSGMEQGWNQSLNKLVAHAERS